MPPGNTELKSPVHPEENVTFRPSRGSPKHTHGGWYSHRVEVTEVKRKEMLNEYTTNLERKGGSLSSEKKKKMGGGWTEESGYGRVQAAKVSQRKKISSIEKNKMFSHSLQMH